MWVYTLSALLREAREGTGIGSYGTVVTATICLMLFYYLKFLV